MPWQAKVIENHRHIELQYSELVTPEELFEAFATAYSLAKKNGIYRFLADCSNMAGGHSIVDLYGLISLFEASGIDHLSKEAILMPAIKASASDVQFYETACRNRGFNVRVFCNRDEAIDWLRE